DFGRRRAVDERALPRRCSILNVGITPHRIGRGGLMANVSINKAGKHYGSFEALKGVSVDIEDGEFVVLVGPSGCGKSTRLRMRADLEEITSGEIGIGNRVLNDLPPKERYIAMVFQNYALYPHMTVAQNMGFSLKLKGVPKTEIK